jgi:hypothetical protein
MKKHLFVWIFGMIFERWNLLDCCFIFALKKMKDKHTLAITNPLFPTNYLSF